MRIDVNQTVITIHDELLIREPLQWQVLNPHNRGYAHGPCQNRSVAICAAPHGDNPRESVSGHLSQRGRRQLLSNQNRPGWIINVLSRCILEIPQNASAQISHIDGALPQIGVLHALKMSNMAEHDLTQRTLSPLTCFDEGCHLPTQNRVIEDVEVNPE